MTGAGPQAEALCAECGGPCTRVDPRCAQCGADPKLAGRYLLRRVLGANVGTTYLADDLQRGGQSVVVKELVFARLDAWKTQELFEREAAVLRQLDHPRIPRCLDSFSVGQGKKLRNYLVQQYFEGRDLRAELVERRYTDEEVLDLMEEVLEILEYLQRLRPPLIHRDLKLSNLMRLRDGKLALIDFGSVRDLLGEGGSNATVAGTFGFMAPEQFQGDAFLQTDLYGLGAVAVQLLSKVSPDKMASAGAGLRWQEHVRTAPPLMDLLARLLAPDPAARPADASAARALVRETRARLHEKPARVATPGSSRRGWALAAGSGIALVCVGVAFLALRADRVAVVRSPPPPREPVAKQATSDAPPRPARSAEESAGPPASSSNRAEPSPLARDLSAAELTALLVAQPWEGNVPGRITFRSSPRGLAARLETSPSPVVDFQRVELGPLATLTLTLIQTVDGVTTTDTFHGALSADRRTLSGARERRYREGVQEQQEEGRWQVSVVGW